MRPISAVLRLWFRLVALAILIGGTGGGIAGAQTFQTAAPQAVLFDMETGAFLFAHGAEERVSPAALTKIMTLEVVFNEIANGRLSLESEMIVSENAWRKGGAPARGPAMFLVPKSSVKVADLITGVIVASGNDAALTLAEGIAGQEENFVALMNRRAAELGFKGMTFRNATGIAHPEQRASLRELVLLAEGMIRTYPELYKLFAQREMTWSKVRQQSRNPLLAMDIGADGLMAAQTEDGQHALLGSALVQGQRLIVAVAGLKSTRDRDLEARKLLDWGFRSFEVRTLFLAGQPIEAAKIYGGASGSVDLVTRADVRLPVPRGTQDRITARLVYPWPVRAPVAAGTPLGRVEVLRNGQVVMSAPAFTASAVDIGSLQQRAIDATIEFGGQLIRDAFARLKAKLNS